jgi:N-acetylated-alpha-linked acidic dipeptidase
MNRTIRAATGGRPYRRASQIIIALTLNVIVGAAAANPSAALAQQPIRGFSVSRTRSQSSIEARFKAIPSSVETRKLHRYLTAEPHPAGSERNNHLARYIADIWEKQGLENVTLHRYDVLNTTPREVSVEMVSPVRYKASLREDAYELDPDTKNPRVHSAYTGLSASGDVTADLVYAHSGNPEDYELLRNKGIDVRGKIVIVRYSNPYSYRGFKALTAQKLGAAAILIYSDPAEDGYRKGKVYPNGPWGPESHIQRGAITYDFLVPGDPLTPGWPSLETAKRVPMDQAVSLPQIIAVPLSWRDAKPLLENMHGPEAPSAWQGGLPIRYRLSGSVKVHVKVDMDNSVKPNYVVEARIRGSEFPDEWIILGNHRDAWEFGGVDPSSGTASMLELTRALGELKKQGIRPRRTLVVCSWDGEEVGLTGSTEWGEHFARELGEKAVAYINVDSSASGPNFSPDAVASLAPLVLDVSRAVNAPSGRSLYSEFRASTARARATAKEKKTPLTDDSLVDTRIGSGSDHTVFLNHLGIPTIGLTFDGPYGVYHSVYDDFYWMNKFGDPGYRYHVLCTQVWGLIALRLANADLLPFDFAFYARHLRQFVEEVAGIKGVRQNLDLRSVRERVNEFERAGGRLNRVVAAALAARTPGSGLSRDVNEKIRRVERGWLDEAGLPGRTWFKHLLYAARYTYAHLELPGLTEAAERGDWDAARSQLKLLEQAIASNSALIDSAAARLAGKP